jgi:putative membrane protein
MNREAQGVVLLLVGGAILRASVTDMYLRYVRAGLRPLLILAGIVLIITALATFWYEFKSRRAARPEPEQAHDDGHAHHDGHGHGHDDGHGHGHREPRVSWLLLLPLFALVLLAPPALGSYAADRSGTALQPPPGFPTLPSGSPLQLSMLDYATRAVYDHGHSLADRQFSITGFVTHAPDGTPELTRMVLNCCAADALPVKVGLIGKVPDGLHADTWLTVTGTYTAKEDKDIYNGGMIPYIDVNQAVRVSTPRDPYDR